MKHGSRQCNAECTTPREYFNVVKKQLGQTQSDLSTMCYQWLSLSFLKSGSQSLFLCGDLLTSHVAAMCLIFPRYDAVFYLEQVPLFPQETGFGHLSWTTGQSRGSSLDYLPEGQNSVTNYYCVHAWHTLDLLLRYKEVTLGTPCKLSESTMCQICYRHSLHAWQVWHDQYVGVIACAQSCMCVGM